MSGALIELFYFIFTTAYDIGTFSRLRDGDMKVQRSITTQVVVIGEARMVIRKPDYKVLLST